MITITISEVEYEIDHTVLTANSIQSGFEILRAPKTGFRKWVGGNYIILNFFVWLVKYADPKTALQALQSYVGNDCYLSLDGTNYITTHRDNEPITFFVFSCEPFYYEGTKDFDVCNFRLFAKTRTEEQHKYLINDLNDYILGSGDFVDGLKLEISE